MFILGLRGASLVQANVSLALDNLIEADRLKPQVVQWVGASLAQRRGLLGILCLAFPCSEVFSLPIWSWALQGYSVLGQDGLIRLVLGVMPVAFEFGGVGGGVEEGRV